MPSGESSLSTSDPIPFVVTRFRCPFCPRTASSKKRTADHIARCWLNPAARGCKTCKHFEPYGPEWSDNCTAGVDLSEKVPDQLDPFDMGSKGGPIVGCDKWEMKTDE